MSTYKTEAIYRKALPWIIRILFLASIVSLFVALVSFIASFWVDEEWLDYKFWTTTFVVCLTLWVISYNLKKFLDIETVKALGNLRTKLNDEKKKDIHYFLLPDCDKKSVISCDTKDKNEVKQLTIDNVDLFDYLGTIELGSRAKVCV